MNVLYVTRADALTKPGGDTIQLQKTKIALEELGVKVILGQAEHEMVAWADIVHVFNAQTPDISLKALLAAKSQGKPSLLSPIWWDLTHSKVIERMALYNLESYDFVEAISRIARQSIRRTKFMQSVEEVIAVADFLLPNSEEEMSVLRSDFGIRNKPYAVIMNAVDEMIFPRSNVSEGGIVCCARIEPTKNQLRLIRAAKSIGVKKLTLVGKKGDNVKYADKVLDEAQRYGYDVFLEHIEQNEIASVMQMYKVHALPSFRESPGLSTLEAISIGLNVVVSDERFCPLDTYFRPLINESAFACNPYSVESLAQNLSLALSSEVVPRRLPPAMTWKGVGAQTYDVYREIAK